MTDRKGTTASSVPRDRGEAAKSQSSQQVGSGKTAEMATLTAAASGLALGAIDMARADSDALENNVFAKLLGDAPDETQLSDTARPENSSDTELNSGSEEAGTAAHSEETVAVRNDYAAEAVTEIAAATPKPEAEMSNADEAVPKSNPVGLEQHVPESMAPSSGSDISAERLTEIVATQIASGIDRIFDGIANGSVDASFAQELSSEIVSDVQSMLVQALPTASDMAATVQSDVRETLDAVGAGVGVTITSSTDVIDHLTGEIGDTLANAGLRSPTDMLGSLGDTSSALAALPAHILGGSEGTGALGHLFYDDGQSVSATGAADQIMDKSTLTTPNIIDLVPLDLGFLGQSSLADLESPIGFSANSNPLHLV